MADFYHEAGKGSKIRSSEDKKKFDEGYEAIFGKKESWLERREREQSKCPAYPSPCACTGACKK